MLERYGINHIFTATHSPQANASERVNRSIIAAIRAYIETDQTTWDAQLPSIASALRNAIHSTTERSPYYVVFGQHMVQHASTYKLLRNIQSLPTGEVEILPPEEFRDKLNDQVRNSILKAREKNTNKYNIRSKEVTFTPGQEVFIRSFKQSDFTKNFNAKLAKQWCPARIVQRKGTALYVVEDRQGKPIKLTYHAKDIRV